VSPLAASRCSALSWWPPAWPATSAYRLTWVAAGRSVTTGRSASAGVDFTNLCFGRMYKFIKTNLRKRVNYKVIIFRFYCCWPHLIQKWSSQFSDDFCLVF
jgi:hypothetical protein